MPYLPLVGVILNFVGTIMMAFAFGKNLGDAYQNDETGRKVYLASFLRPRLFRVGIVVFVLGFVCQIIAEAFKII